eukprot:scaffold193719_cov35-Prasinocladus_malaysianus.AAC.1
MQRIGAQALAAYQDGDQLDMDTESDGGVHICEVGVEGHQGFIVPGGDGPRAPAGVVSQPAWAKAKDTFDEISIEDDSSTNAAV